MSLAPRKSAEAPFDAKFVGIELRKHRDRVVAGMMLATDKDTHTKVAIWRVVQVPPAAPDAADAK